MKQGKDGWLELSQDDMQSETAAAYEAYKLAYRHAQSLKAEYERAMLAQAGLPEGKALVFGYNFGKASIKVVEASERKAKAQAKPQLSLKEFLAQAEANGTRS